MLYEEVYVEQPKEFVNPEYHDHVYKLKKELHGLKQAPRAWYEILANYLLNRGYKCGGADKTMFVKNTTQHLLIAQVHGDGIAFASTLMQLTNEFITSIRTKFKMSVVGELIVFIGL